VFRALGFARPEEVDLTGFNICWVDMRERTDMDRAQSKFAKISYEDCRDVFDYRLAIKKRKLKLTDGNDPHW
jgi:xanthine dehydrogenase molybdopterin-binding subunit B